jgi:spermidine synthase
LSTRSTLPHSALLFTLVAISGSASLTYELLWIRALGLHFGTSTSAITIVVSTFMGGLGLGYVWFGTRADRSAAPYALYQRLELAIAASGLAVSLFLLRGGGWLDAIARLCAAMGTLSGACTAAVLALLMLAPTVAMGGTVPVLASALSRRVQPGRALGMLYACNTLGAIAGALLPDFVLIPRFGMTFTACAAAAANLSIALCAGRLVTGESSLTLAGSSTATATATLAVERSNATRTSALVLSAACGFCALGYEVLWSRTLQHWAAALVTSFAVLLAVYLAALAFGALATQRIADRCPSPLSAACVLMGLTALSAALPLWAAPAWRDLARACWPRPLGVRRVGLGHEAIDALLHAGFLELAPCLLMGATFPFLAAAWLGTDKPGTRTGQLFLVNTFAGVLGTLCVGFGLLPRLGEQSSYCVLALLLAAVAALCALRVARAEGVRLPSLGNALCLIGVIAISLCLPRSQLSRAHFRGGGEIIAIQEGATTTAAAAAHFLYAERHHVELLTPGISMSTTRGDARRYMAMMAHAAVLAARGSARALLICYGVGNTASALLAHGRLQRLDVVDISPEVLALSEHFAAARGSDPLRDPRTHVFVDDGRHHLITHDTRYDIITAEPPPPNYAGVANLYSRELYRLARGRLAAGGVITQWLPVFQLADDDVRAMIAAFVAELPHTALLYGYDQELILIGSSDPLVMRTQVDPALTQALQHSYIGGIEDVLGAVLQTDAELRAHVQGIEPLSDERPTIQYPRQDVREGTFYSSRFAPDSARALSLLPQRSEPALQQRVRAAGAAIQHALSALPLRDVAPPEARELALGRALAPALAERADDQGLWSLLGIDSDRARLADLALGRPGAFELVSQPRAAIGRRDRARYLVLQDALWMLARRAFYAGDYPRALELLQRIDPEPSERARHGLLVAGCLRALQQTRASAQAFRVAAANSGDPAFRAQSLSLAERVAVGSDVMRDPWDTGE